MHSDRSTQLYTAERIFTGSEWLTGKAIVVIDGIVTSIEDAPAGAAGEGILAPAFIDIQIYGAYGKLFSVYPEPSSLHLLRNYCVEGGATHFQPTVATNATEVFFRCIDAVRAYWAEGGEGCIGLHVEGPWIHPSKKGAHIESFIHSPSVQEVRELLEYGKGVITMITLAPEVCSREVIELIRSYGVVISAGHSNATYEEATKAFDEGITTATHLYNAMSALQHRAPGMVGAVLDHASARSSIVPDGYHVDFAALRIAKKIMKERLFVITDAVTETDQGPYQHYRNGDKYEAAGILSGSALTMAHSLRNLVHHAGIDLDEALRMCSLYPAQVMGKDDRWGRIAVGLEANFVRLDMSCKLLAVSDK